MKARRVYSLKQIQEISKRLAATKAEDKPERSLTASGAIALMIAEIKALQARGYTISEIAELLRQNDLPVTAATLKSAIARAQASRQARRRTQPQGSMSRSSQRHSTQTADRDLKQATTSGSFQPIADSDDI